MNNMLELHHLKKYYATQKAVDDISLSIREGSIFGLLGPNGAGKSSLLRMVTGITMPDEGNIVLDKEAFNPVIHSAYIGYMPEERGLYKKMKVGEQALYLAQLKGLSKVDAMVKINYWFDRLDMKTWWNKKVEDLSKGMSQKLQFVITVLHEPKMLILDEPFSGLDPLNSEIIKKEIFELAQKGTTIVFSTHRMEQVEEICEDIALINLGKVVLSGSVHDIKHQFKENKFKLVTDKEIQGFDQLIIDKSGTQYTLQYTGNDDAKIILQHCLQHDIQILSYQEILPSLNEIFIKKVEGSAARKFESNNN
jgi:ABC-2 type transport system ATP-binding protein